MPLRTRPSAVHSPKKRVSRRRLDLKAFYNRRYWAASYNFGQNLVENRSNQLRTDQKRHELWASGTRPLLANRLSLGFSGRLSRLNRDSRVGDQVNNCTDHGSNPTRLFFGITPFPDDMSAAE